MAPTSSPKFRSKFERDVFQAAKEKDPLVAYEPFRLAYEVVHHYTPDIVLANNILVEVKGSSPGWRDGSDRAKLMRIREAYPEYDIRLVFMNPNGRISPRSKTTNAQWADKKGFIWASKRIPDEWFEEDRRV